MAIILLFTWEGVLELIDDVINDIGRIKVGKGASKLAVTIAAVSVLALGMCAVANAKAATFRRLIIKNSGVIATRLHPQEGLTDGSFPDCTPRPTRWRWTSARSGARPSPEHQLRAAHRPEAGDPADPRAGRDWRALRRILEISAHYRCLGLEVWTVEAREGSSHAARDHARR